MVAIVSAIINLLLNYIFIHKFGYIAAGYTTFISYLLLVILDYVFMKYLCKKNSINTSPYNIKLLTFIMITFIGGCFIFMCLYNHVLIRYTIIVVITLGIIFNYKRIKTVVRKYLEDIRKED
jgi:O-antigen/teichoic acid export membrane protein